MTAPARSRIRSIAAVAVLFLATVALHFAAQQAEKQGRGPFPPVDAA